MSDKDYTNNVAQVIDATGDAVKGTNPYLVYYIIMVCALMGIMYFLAMIATGHFSKIEEGLSNNHEDLSRIHDDLSDLTDILKGIEYGSGFNKQHH